MQKSCQRASLASLGACPASDNAWHAGCFARGVDEIAITSGPFALVAGRTPTGGVALRQRRDSNPEDARIFVPAQDVRALALYLARVAAERADT